LADVAAGRPGAVARCVDRYGGLVWTLARRMSPTDEDARDAVQEVFVDLWTHAHRFDPERGTEPGFVTLVARRRLIDRHRAATRRPPWGQVSAPVVRPARAEALVDASRIGEAIDALAPAEREVLTLSLLEGLSHQEIANRTGSPLGTVKDRIRRSLRRVRDAFGGRP
jgi:RNA polymerase sigma-70 factor (ECF subfamily)